MVGVERREGGWREKDGEMRERGGTRRNRINKPQYRHCMLVSYPDPL